MVFTPGRRLTDQSGTLLAVQMACQTRLAPKASPWSDQITFHKVKSKILSQGRRAEYTSMCSLLHSPKHKLRETCTKSFSQNSDSKRPYFLIGVIFINSPEWKSGGGGISFINITFPNDKTLKKLWKIYVCPHTSQCHKEKSPIIQLPRSNTDNMLVYGLLVSFLSRVLVYYLYRQRYTYNFSARTISSHTYSFGAVKILSR